MTSEDIQILYRMSYLQEHEILVMKRLSMLRRDGGCDVNYECDGDGV